MQARLPNPSRLGSLSAVVLLHVAAIGLFASGLQLRPAAPAAPPPVVLKDPEPLPRPKIEPLPVQQQPVLRPQQLIVVTPPEVLVHATVEPSLSVTLDEQARTPEGGAVPRPQEVELPAQPVLAASKPLSAGMLCSRMPAPELPVALDQAAELRVLGTVRGGRVVAVEFVGQRGLSDRRALRQLQQSVDRALRDYQCSSEGRFEQAFLFKPE